MSSQSPPSDEAVVGTLIGVIGLVGERTGMDGTEIAVGVGVEIDGADDDAKDANTERLLAASTSEAVFGFPTPFVPTWFPLLPFEIPAVAPTTGAATSPDHESKFETTTCFSSF